MTTQHVLQECRQKFGPAPRSFSYREKRYLKLKPPAWCWTRMDPLMQFYKNQDLIREQGQVVWGHIVQANQLLFQPGSDDCPAAVVYSSDPWFDGHVDVLEEIATQLFELKGTRPADPQLAQIARYLTAETERQTRLSVPRQWAGGREVYLGDIMVHRKHLPAGYLAQSYFPVIVHTSEPRNLMVLPSLYWGDMLLAAWQEAVMQDIGAAVSDGVELLQPSTGAILGKVFIGMVGVVLLFGLFCAGLVGGLLAFRGENRKPANQPWNPPAAQQPAWQPPDFQQPAFQPGPRGMPPEIQRMREESRRRHEQFMEESRQRHEEMIQRQRRMFDQ